jgi:hypothetical protein
MNTTPRKLKRAVGNAARRAKRQFITRAEARRRAERHVANRMFKGATVRDGAEAGNCAYGARREDTWVVYKNSSALELRPSEIIVVCKRTGRVLYEGPANDEG